MSKIKALLLAASLGMAVSACILPDRDIQFCPEPGNGSIMTAHGVEYFDSTLQQFFPILPAPSYERCLSDDEWLYFTNHNAECFAAGGPANMDSDYQFRVAVLQAEMVAACRQVVQDLGSDPDQSTCAWANVVNVCPELRDDIEGCSVCPDGGTSEGTGESGSDETGETGSPQTPAGPDQVD